MYGDGLCPYQTHSEQILTLGVVLQSVLNPTKLCRWGGMAATVTDTQRAPQTATDTQIVPQTATDTQSVP